VAGDAFSTLPADLRAELADDSPVAARRRLMVAWAKESATGRLVYIGELPRERTGLKCACECYGCGEQLEAVNAGVDQAMRAPHFRHLRYTPTNKCSLLVARAALLHRLGEARIDRLPARKLRGEVRGLYGGFYVRESVIEEQLARVVATDIEDQMTAVLTLIDGRQVLVRLSGSVDVSPDGHRLPTIVIASDDPAVANMSAEELRTRIQQLVLNGQWVGPELDGGGMAPQLQAQALADAVEALDAVPIEAESEIGLTPTRETLLHWTAKELLRELKSVVVPDIELPWEDWMYVAGVTPFDLMQDGGDVPLEEVRLEKQLGRTRPDLLAEMYGEPEEYFSGPIAIEVTVTHAIDRTRLERIRAEDVACLELDLSGLPRDTTRTHLKGVLQYGKVPTYWVHHPAFDARRDKFWQQVLDASDSQLAHWFSADFLVVHRYLDSGLNWGAYTGERNEAKRRLAALGVELNRRGYRGAKLTGDDTELVRVLGRLYSIRDNKPISYRITSLWQVVNAIMTDRQRARSRGYHFLFLVALKAYGRHFPADQQEKIDAWRERARRGIEEPGDIYYRRRAYDELVALLFPEMGPGLTWSSKGHR